MLNRSYFFETKIDPHPRSVMCSEMRSCETWGMLWGFEIHPRIEEQIDMCCGFRTRRLVQDIPLQFGDAIKFSTTVQPLKLHLES